MRSVNHFQVVKPSDIKDVCRQLPYVREWLRKPAALEGVNVLSLYGFLLHGKIDPRSVLAWSRGTVAAIETVVAMYAEHDKVRVQQGDIIPKGSVGVFVPAQFTQTGVLLFAGNVRLMRFCGNLVRPSALVQPTFQTEGTAFILKGEQ